MFTHYTSHITISLSYSLCTHVLVHNSVEVHVHSSIHVYITAIIYGILLLCNKARHVHVQCIMNEIYIHMS